MGPLGCCHRWESEVNSARADLCGRRWVTTVPTTTIYFALVLTIVDPQKYFWKLVSIAENPLWAFLLRCE
jgi:hypothetical protein